MSKTEVILNSNIVGLGAESDQVRVSAGYARNYLLPQGLAVPVTAVNKRRLEALRQRRAEREAHELNTMSELSKSLQKLICVVKVKTGEDGKMFGAVTNGMIADEMKTQFDVSLDKKKIHLEHPIRTLGDHEVELHLHPDVKGVLKVRVESSTPLPEPAAAPPGSVKTEDGRVERRGRRFERVGKSEKPEGAEMKSTRVEKPGKPERAPKAEKSPKPEESPRAEKPA